MPGYHFLLNVRTPEQAHGPGTQGESPLLPTKQIQQLEFPLEASFPKLSRSQVPGFGVGSENCPPQRKSPLLMFQWNNKKSCQLAVGAPPQLLIPPGASELQAGILFPTGAVPTLLHTHTHSLLTALPFPKCTLHTATQPRRERMKLPGPLSRAGRLANEALPRTLWRGKVWGSPRYPNSLSAAWRPQARGQERPPSAPLRHLAFSAQASDSGRRRTDTSPPTPPCLLKENSAPWNLAVLCIPPTRHSTWHSVLAQQ